MKHEDKKNILNLIDKFEVSKDKLLVVLLSSLLDEKKAKKVIIDNKYGLLASLLYRNNDFIDDVIIKTCFDKDLFILTNDAFGDVFIGSEEWLDGILNLFDYFNCEKISENIFYNIVSYCPNFFNRLPEHLQENRKFVLELAMHSGYILEFVSEIFKNDREIVIAAVKNGGWALKFASNELRADKEVVLEAVRNIGWALEFVCDKYKNDKDVVMAAVSNEGQALVYASPELVKDKDVVLAAVWNDATAWEYVPVELKNDKEFFIEVVEQYGAYMLEYASEKLKNDKEVFVAVFKQYGGYVLKYASDGLKKDVDFVVELLDLYMKKYEGLDSFDPICLDNDVILNIQKMYGDKYNGYYIEISDDDFPF